LPSLFVPEEYVSHTFEISIAGNVHNPNPVHSATANPQLRTP
jgi:hypothetical protein